MCFQIFQVFFFQCLQVKAFNFYVGCGSIFGQISGEVWALGYQQWACDYIFFTIYISIKFYINICLYICMYRCIGMYVCFYFNNHIGTHFMLITTTCRHPLQPHLWHFSSSIILLIKLILLQCMVYSKDTLFSVMESC